MDDLEPGAARAAALYDQTPIPPEMTGWAMPASLALHIVLLAALAITPQALEPSDPQPVIADILSAAEYDALFNAPAAQEAAEVVSEPPPDATTQSEAPVTDEFTSATTFHASDILNDPTNGEVRRNLPRLAPSEQVVQLCNIEALEQLRLNGLTEADALVGYAYAPIDIDGLALSADGGAFRSQGQWFHIRYRCTVTADISAVTLFEYVVEDMVPESEWEAHYLNADDDWLN